MSDGNAEIARTYGSLPLSFAPNRQADEGVDLGARGAGYGLTLHPTGAVVALTKGAPPAAGAARRDPPPCRFGRSTRKVRGTDLVRIDVVGADPAAAADGQDSLGGRVNYFTGKDPGGWHRTRPDRHRVPGRREHHGWLAKLSPDGSLDFSTYVGGRGFDSGSGLAVDARGAAYMVGITGSPDFPNTPGAFDTTFQGVGGSRSSARPTS